MTFRRPTYMAAIARLVALCLLSLTLTSIPMTPAVAATPMSSSSRAFVSNIRPADDPFYRYSGEKPLKRFAPGSVLKSRVRTLHLAGLPLPVRSTQTLYRSTGTRGQATATVATIIEPPLKVFPSPRLISYQFAYDALSSDCNPSYNLAGGGLLGGTSAAPTTQAELLHAASFLLQGYTVVISDYEGPNLEWVAGHTAGHGVLDGVRAAIREMPELTPATPIGLIGYSGGGIASSWAAEMAQEYAPELRIVGTAAGAFAPNLAHNMKYVDGSLVWSSVLPAALVGLSRAYNEPLSPYLSDYGARLVKTVSSQCIIQFLGRYPGLKVSKIFRPRFSNPLAIPAIARILKNEVMGRRGTPNAPVTFYAAQNDGTGDGVMVAADIRQLARTYCRRGARVKYVQLNGLEHFTGFAAFELGATQWLTQRFTTSEAPSTCSTLL